MNTRQPYFDDGVIQLWHGDCREVLADLPAQPCPLVLTDPPYGVGQGAAFLRNNLKVNNFDNAGFNQVVLGWRDRIVPFLAPNCYVVEFLRGSIAALENLLAEHRALGLTPWRQFLLVKQAPPPTPRATFVSGWESCLISYQGKRSWYGKGTTLDYWYGLTPNRRNEGQHPTEKPIAAIKQLILALTQPGDLVLDPFAGSGTTLRAAKDLGRRAIGVEIDAGYCTIAAKRFRQEVLL